jgi:hypothetical protein
MLFHHVSANPVAAPNCQTHNNWGSLRIVCTTACAILTDLFCGSDEGGAAECFSWWHRGDVESSFRLAKRSLPRHWRVLKPDCRKRQTRASASSRGGKSFERALRLDNPTTTIIEGMADPNAKITVHSLSGTLFPFPIPTSPKPPHHHYSPIQLSPQAPQTPPVKSPS